MKNIVYKFNNSDETTSLKDKNYESSPKKQITYLAHIY